MIPLMGSIDDLVGEQIEQYVDLGYPEMASLAPERFRTLLRQSIPPVVGDAPTTSSREPGRYPAVLVVTDRLIPVEQRVDALRWNAGDRKGVVDPNHGPEGLKGYRPLPGLDVPDESVYLLVDVERGDSFRGETPDEAVGILESRGRSPLTIDEGVSLAALHPEALESNHCFMLAGSSRGDRRVPALWIADRAPKLGWCWKGNRHSWLGIASTARRTP